MSNKLKIMAQAEEAKLVLGGYDADDGDRRFSELLRDHPDDGMIFFKRGEAYETIGQPEKAIKDFQVAESIFPMREWKHLASQGIDRCKTDIRLSRLERGLRPIWTEVIHMPIWPARARPMMARAAIERTAGVLLSQFRIAPRGSDLKDKLDALGASRKVDRKVLDDMVTIKGFGDAAAHGENIGEHEAKLCDEAARRVVAWLVTRRNQVDSKQAV
jgi:tetratricopeptide (TPR) repeat protein